MLLTLGTETKKIPIFCQHLFNVIRFRKHCMVCSRAERLLCAQVNIRL